MKQVVESFTEINWNRAHNLLIINGLFLFVYHSYWCGLAAMFAPEAKKKKTHHITKRKHLRIEVNCKYLG